jgi:hypothetical protein
VRDVWVSGGERLGDGGRVAPEQEHGTIHGIGQCSPEHQVAAGRRGAAVRQMRRPEGLTTIDVVFHDLVEQ